MFQFSIQILKASPCEVVSCKLISKVKNSRMNLSQSERETYLGRCQAQLAVELAQPLEKVENRDRFKIFEIYDQYCPFTDVRLELWSAMKPGKVVDSNVIWDNVTWRGEEIKFSTLFDGNLLHCTISFRVSARSTFFDFL